MAWWWAGHTLEHARTLVHTGAADPPELELSVYASGVLCCDLWRGCRLVLDGPLARAAVAPLLLEP